MQIARTIKILTFLSKTTLDCSVLFMVPVFILIAAAAGGHPVLDIGRLLQPAFLSFFGELNFLLYERFLFRMLMAVGYVLQNREKIRGSIPVAFVLAAQLIALVASMVFGDNIAVISKFRETISTGKSFINCAVNYCCRCVVSNFVYLLQCFRLNILRADAFFWCSGQVVVCQS